MKLIRVLTVLFIVVIAFGFGAVAQVKGSTGEFTIAGIVVDNHSGQPLVSTTVSIAPTEAQTDSRSAITGPDGRFRFTGLAKGKYSMLGKRRGYLAQGFDEHEQYSSAIAVGPDQDSSHLVFRLHPDAAIRGRILDESNEAVPQMQVMLFSTRNDLGRRSTRMVSQTTTNDLGEYFFTHLGEGTYYLLAVGRPWYSGNSQHLNRFDRIRRQREGMSTTPEHERLVEQESALLNQSYPLTFFDNVQDWTQASGIDLAPGDGFTADFRVTAVPAATLHIKTAASENRPLEQGPNMTRVVLQAKVFDDQTIPVRMNYGNAADGSRALVGIPPGHYLVQTRNPSDPHDSVQELDISGEMDLPPASGGSGAVVSGKFVWDGTPMTGGFGVQLTNSRTDRHYFFMPRPNGEFVVSESVLPGKYELAVSSQFGEVYVKSVTIGEQHLHPPFKSKKEPTSR